MSDPKKKAVFATVQVPCAQAADLVPFISTSSFGIYIERRLGTWESYRTQIQEAVKSGCSFHSEIFRRSAPGLRKILTLDLLQTLANCDPGRAQTIFENLSHDVKVNIAAVVDLICACPRTPGIVEWAGRQLSNIEVDWEEMLCHPKIKCAMLAYRREKWRSAKNPGELCWGILMRDNTFHLYTAAGWKELTKPEHQGIPVDIIAQSRSGRTVKVQRDLNKINVILVVPNFDRELWEHQALRLKGLPFYYTFGAYPGKGKIPSVLLEAALEMIKKPGMMIARALLHPKVLKPQDAKPVLTAFWIIFSSCDRIHEFITVVAASEMLRTESKDPNLILREKGSFLAALYRMMVKRYCLGYVREVVFPICWNVVNGGLGAVQGTPEGVDADRVFQMLANAVDALAAKADMVPSEIRHFASIVVKCVGLHYGTQEAVMIALSRLMFGHLLSAVMKEPKEFDEASPLAQSSGETLANASDLIQILASFSDFGEKYPLLMRLNSRMPQLRDTLSRFLLTVPATDRPVAYGRPDQEVPSAVSMIYQAIYLRKAVFNETIKAELLMRDNNPMAWGVMQFLMSLGGYSPDQSMKKVPTPEDRPKSDSGYNSGKEPSSDQSDHEEKKHKKKSSKKKGKDSPDVTRSKKSKSKKKESESEPSWESDPGKKRSSKKAKAPESPEAEDGKPKKATSSMKGSQAKANRPPDLTPLPLQNLRNAFKRKANKQSSSEQTSSEEAPKKKSSKKANAKTPSPKKEENSSDYYEAEESYFDDPRERSPLKAKSGRSTPKAKREIESSEEEKPRRASMYAVGKQKPIKKSPKRKVDDSSESSDSENVGRSRKGTTKSRNGDKDVQKKSVKNEDELDGGAPFKSARMSRTPEGKIQKKQKRVSSPIRPRKLGFSSDDEQDKKKSKRKQETESSSADSYEPSSEDEKPKKTSAKSPGKKSSTASPDPQRKRSLSNRSPKPELKKPASDSESDSEPAPKKKSISKSSPKPEKKKPVSDSESDSEPAPKKKNMSKGSPRSPEKKKPVSDSESDSEPAPKQSVSKGSQRSPEKKKPVSDSESDSEPAPKKKSVSNTSPKPEKKKPVSDSDSEAEPTPKKSPSKGSQRSPEKKKQVESETDSEPAPKKPVKASPSLTPEKKKPVSDSESDSEPLPKKSNASKTPSRTPEKKKVDSDSDSEPMPKKASPKASPRKKESESDSDTGKKPGSPQKQDKKARASSDSSSEPVKKPSPKGRASDASSGGAKGKAQASPRTLAQSIAGIWSDSSDEGAKKSKQKSKPPLPPTPPRKKTEASSDSEPKTPESKKRSKAPSSVRSTTPDVRKTKPSTPATKIFSDDSDDELDSASVFRSARRRKERRASQGLKTSSAKKVTSLFSSSDSM